MIDGGLLVGLGVAGGSLGYAYWRIARFGAALERAAQKLGLQYHRSVFRPRATGRLGGVEVEIRMVKPVLRQHLIAGLVPAYGIWAFSKRKDRATRVDARAAFPPGLELAPEGGINGVIAALGGPDIQLGVSDLDRKVRV